LNREEYEELFPETNTNTTVPWKCFRGNEDWKLDTVAPIEYNSCLVYDGGFFHSAYVPELAFLDEHRYSLVGMGIRNQNE
jgi:hypothetical protein